MISSAPTNKNSAPPLLCASAPKILTFLGQRGLLNLQGAEDRSR